MNKPARWNAKRARTAQGGLDNHLDIASDPEFATHREDPPGFEPKVVFQQWKGRQRNECIRGTLSLYKDKPVFDLRVFFTTPSGHMQATKKGITVAVAKLPDLRKALEKAEGLAIDLDLIEATS
jgi:hypothetical protein